MHIEIDKYVKGKKSLGKVVKNFNLGLGKYVYIIGLHDGLYKVGCSRKLPRRLATHLQQEKRWGYRGMRIILVIPTEYPESTEAKILSGVGMKPDKWKEYFRFSENDLDLIKTLV